MLQLRPYLEGIRFIIRTDHNALKWAVFLANAEGRLAKWRLRPAVTHSVPEALSRFETTKPDQGEIDDQIPRFSAGSPDSFD